jgi:type II secretory pathway pseudopilin PulG
VRPFFTGLWLFGLPVLWLIAIWWFLRSPRPGAVLALTLGDFVHVITAVFTVAGILIAVASYQYAMTVGQRQLAAAQEQGRALEEQRQALDASRRSLEQVLQAFEKGRPPAAEALPGAAPNVQTTETLVEAGKQQEDKDRPRVITSPRLEFNVGEVEWSTIQSGTPTRLALSGGKALVDLVVRNVGNAPLVKPHVVLRALPSTVAIDPPKFPRSASTDIPPVGAEGAGYTYSFTMTVPDDVQSFVVVVAIEGDNLARQTVKLPIEVVTR